MHWFSRGSRRLSRRTGLGVLLVIVGACGDDESSGPEEPEIVGLRFTGDGFDDWAGIQTRGALFIEGEAEPVEMAEDTVSSVGGAWIFPTWDVERGATYRFDVYLDVNADASCVEGDDVMWSVEKVPDGGTTFVTLFPPTAVEPTACASLNEVF